MVRDGAGWVMWGAREEGGRGFGGYLSWNWMWGLGPWGLGPGSLAVLSNPVHGPSPRVLAVSGGATGWEAQSNCFQSPIQLREGGKTHPPCGVPVGLQPGLPPPSV